MNAKAKETPAGDGLPDAAAAMLRTLSARFMANLPQNSHASGHFTAAAGDAFAEDDYADVPNGTYRVAGADWCFVIKKHKFVSAHRATPPTFGGPDVIAVPNR